MTNIQEEAKLSGTVSEQTGSDADHHMPSPAKAKYDWYQTESDVVITILLKDVRQEDVKIHFTDECVGVTVKLGSGSDYSLELDVAHRIDPNRSSYKVLKTRIEMKLRKQEALRWEKLERVGPMPAKEPIQVVSESAAAVSAPAYPTSFPKGPKNWDKLVNEIQKEEEDEKLEGDAAVNKLFQQIYGQGTDEVKKAMLKSFTESGGTVLSTNWNEVKKETVPVKPPDGMEFKKY